ncbi:hypothetical protein [Microvirga pudoricolor]|uniref:hypothetical protein n=1 Tax=Microvirga pudoricolor TaxID=2778729 RepID=UPI00195010EE|nr:hypothetical protein [Microvirga pudoricolor]MBM6593798.1 hypothetical protein [Microvirga pudoricolor]
MTSLPDRPRGPLAARLPSLLHSILRTFGLKTRPTFGRLADPRWLSDRLREDARLPHSRLPDARRTRQEDWWSRPPPPL